MYCLPPRGLRHWHSDHIVAVEVLPLLFCLQSAVHKRVLDSVPTVHRTYRMTVHAVQCVRLALTNTPPRSVSGCGLSYCLGCYMRVHHPDKAYWVVALEIAPVRSRCKRIPLPPHHIQLVLGRTSLFRQCLEQCLREILPAPFRSVQNALTSLG